MAWIDLGLSAELGCLLLVGTGSRRWEYLLGTEPALPVEEELTGSVELFPAPFRLGFGEGGLHGGGGPNELLDWG